MTRTESHGATHFGRGGTGNVAINPDEAEDDRQQRQKGGDESAVVDDDGESLGKSPGWAERGKQFLFGR